MVYFPAASPPLIPSSLTSPTVTLIIDVTHYYPNCWHHQLLPSSLALPTVTLITGITHCYPHRWCHPLLLPSSLTSHTVALITGITHCYPSKMETSQTDQSPRPKRHRKAQDPVESQEALAAWGGSGSWRHLPLPLLVLCCSFLPTTSLHLQSQGDRLHKLV